MAEGIESTTAKPKRNTGDWRGLPNVLGVLAALGIVAVPIGAAAMYGDSDVPGAVIAAAIFNGWLSCVGLYVAAAIVAALRGPLNR